MLDVATGSLSPRNSSQIRVDAAMEDVMSRQITPKLLVYTDLTSSQAFTNAWQPYDAFPLRQSDRDVIEKLRLLCGVQLAFEGKNGNKTNPEFFYSNVRNWIKDFMLEINGSKYLFACEGEVSLKSKVRSYKGIFFKKILVKMGQYIEYELNIDEHHSIIFGMARLTEENINEIMEFFDDSRTSFILYSHGDQVIEERFVVNLFRLSAVVHPLGWIQINYLNLVLDRCFHGDYIYRMIGGRDQEVYLQIFLQQQKLDELVRRIHFFIEEGQQK
jgi:hypothetical protein